MLSKVTILLSALSSAALIRAAPVFPPASGVNDTNVANFALTLEHLEHQFYEEGLQQYDAQAFADAGFEPWVRGRFAQIRDAEQAHVDFLVATLAAAGVAAVEPCTYSFPYTDVQSWVSLSMVLETVGASAYLGAGRYISDKDILIAASSISQIEARQAGWVSSSAKQLQPWDGHFETPLNPSGALSLAVGFIESCPSTNPAIPASIFPALAVSSATPSYNDEVELTYTLATEVDGQTYLAWYSGLNTTFTPITDGKTTVPDGLLGTVYGGVVSNATADASMLTGLAAFQFPFTSYARGEA